MIYEKPIIIDLSSRPEKGFGGFCGAGSGETYDCGDGQTAINFCDAGPTNLGGGFKYDD